MKVFVVLLFSLDSLVEFHSITFICVLLWNSNKLWVNQNLLPLLQPQGFIVQVLLRERSASFMLVLVYSVILSVQWLEPCKEKVTSWSVILQPNPQPCPPEQNKHPLQSFNAIWSNMAYAGGDYIKSGRWKEMFLGSVLLLSSYIKFLNMNIK